MRTLSTLFVILILSSCTPKKADTLSEETKPEKQETSSNQDKTGSLSRRNRILRDSINLIAYDLGTKSLVFITPDSIEIDELKAKYGDDFYTIADDQNYYFLQSIDFLNDRSMPYEVTQKRFIKLKLNHKWNHTDHPVKEILIDTDSIAHKWAVIMHDGYLPPVISTYMDLPIDFEKLNE